MAAILPLLSLEATDLAFPPAGNRTGEISAALIGKLTTKPHAGLTALPSSSEQLSVMLNQGKVRF